MLSMIMMMRDALLAIALGWLGVSFAPAQPETNAAGGCAAGAAGVACADNAVGWGGDAAACRQAR